MLQASGAFLHMAGRARVVHMGGSQDRAFRAEKIFSSDCIVPLDKIQAMLISCVMEKRRKGAYKMAVSIISPRYAQRISACL